MWGQSCPMVVLFLLWYFIISVSVHVWVYDVGCFVDVLASQSGYSGRKPSVPMIAILLSSSVGLSIRVTDWCVTGPGFAPRRVHLWIKNSIVLLGKRLNCDNTPYNISPKSVPKWWWFPYEASVYPKYRDIFPVLGEVSKFLTVTCVVSSPKLHAVL